MAQPCPLCVATRTASAMHLLTQTTASFSPPHRSCTQESRASVSLQSVKYLRTPVLRRSGSRRRCLMCGWPPGCKDFRSVMARQWPLTVMCPAFCGGAGWPKNSDFGGYSAGTTSRRRAISERRHRELHDTGWQRGDGSEAGSGMDPAVGGEKSLSMMR